MSDCITIDGPRGEGGGQILRTALGLSLVTGRPVRFEKIRARRSNPGLLRQHLTAVQAAAAIGRARVAGAELGSQSLLFEPGEIHGGEYHLAIGTAGSTTLVLQTVLPALALAPEPSALTLESRPNTWRTAALKRRSAFATLVCRLASISPTSAACRWRSLAVAGSGRCRRARMRSRTRT